MRNEAVCMTPACIVVFARALELGRVKTRIARDAGDEVALALYRQMLARALAQACASGNDVVIAATDPHCPALGAMAQRYQCALIGQHGADLGERMRHALRQQHRQYDRVILIGSDAPVIDAAHLGTAFAGLEHSDIVITPAEDGGYVLIGSSASHVWQAHPFAGVRWSSRHTLMDTQARLHALGVRVTMLDILWDVDTLADARRASEAGLLVLPVLPLPEESIPNRNTCMAGFEMPDMDQDLLSELQDIMGSDFATLVASWQRDTAQRLSAIQDALTADDGPQLRQVAHSLKGSSSNLGARGVVDLCIEMEKLANLNQLDQARELLPQLRQAVNAAEQELVRLAS